MAILKKHYYDKLSSDMSPLLTDVLINKSNNRLNNFLTNINESYSLLDLKEDWDGNDGSPPNQKTFQRMTNFLIWFENFLDRRNVSFPLKPNFSATNDGSIDIHFNNEKYEMLVNVSNNQEEGVSFYLDDLGKSFWIKGGFNRVFEKEIEQPIILNSTLIYD